MGFINWKKCFKSPNQVVKLLILCGCFVFAVYQTAKCIEKLMKPPISTHYGFHLNDTMRYPSITICRRTSFKNEHFAKYGLRRTQNLMLSNLFRNFYFSRYSIEDFLNETTWHFDEVLGSYAYNGNGNSAADVNWTEFQSVSHGRCFTSTARSTSKTFSISGGWWFYLKHDMKVRIVDSFAVSQYGFHVFMHHPNEIMTSEYDQETNFLEYIYLEAAEDLRISLKYQSFTRVNTKEEPCVDDDPDYSRTKCLEQCLHQEIVIRTNCTLPWLWLLQNSTSYPQCNNFTQVNMLITRFLSHHRRYLIQNCTCPMSCEVTIYTPSIISRKEVTDERQFPDSFIAMYYTNNIVTHMTEIIGYNLNGFVSDIGGSLGFLLGLSVIGSIALLEQMLCSIIKTFYKNKQKVEEQKTEEKEIQSNGIYYGERINQDTHRLKETHLYDNLRDFESDDFKCYQKTLIEETNRF